MKSLSWQKSAAHHRTYAECDASGSSKTTNPRTPCGLRQMISHPFHPIGCGYQYQPDSFRACSAFPIVTFGNRHLIMEADHNKRRAIAADHMQRYLDYLETLDRLPQAPPPDAVGTPSLKA